MKTKLRSIVLAVLFWLGIGICVIAVAHNWDQSRSIASHIGVSGWGLVLAMLVSLLLLAVIAWRNIVLAYVGTALSWSEAARHLGLLLIGKYVPGGAWGFLMRLADSITPSRSPARMVVAGVAEQSLGLLITTMVGVLFYVAAVTVQPMWLLLVIALPPICIALLLLGAKAASGLRNHLPESIRLVAEATAPIRMPALWYAGISLVVQSLLLLGVVVTVAVAGLGVGMTEAFGLAGSYGLGIALGIAAIFVPGGVVVREATFVALALHWVGTDQAVAVAGALRLLFTALDIAAGAFAGICLGRRIDVKHA